MYKHKREQMDIPCMHYTCCYSNGKKRKEKKKAFLGLLLQTHAPPCQPGDAGILRWFSEQDTKTGWILISGISPHPTLQQVCRIPQQFTILILEKIYFCNIFHIPLALLCCFKSELVFKYLWEGSRIKSKHFLVTTGIYSCPSWAQSTCYTWIKNWLWMVLAMGEFSTQETLRQNKKRHNERWDYLWKLILHYKECISNFIATPQNANTQ